MGEKFDEMKGRAKEGVGEATDNEEMEREGKLDRAKAEAKEKVNKVTDKVKDALD